MSDDSVKKSYSELREKGGTLDVAKADDAGWEADAEGVGKLMGGTLSEAEADA